MIINVNIEDREDGGVHIWSNDLPGLILSGRDRTRVIADIEPAARAILKHKDIEFSDLRIDATYENWPRWVRIVTFRDYAGLAYTQDYRMVCLSKRSKQMQSELDLLKIRYDELLLIENKSQSDIDEIAAIEMRIQRIVFPKPPSRADFDTEEEFAAYWADRHTSEDAVRS